MIDLLQPVRDDSAMILWCRENLKPFADMQDKAEVNQMQYREMLDKYANNPRPYGLVEAA